MSLHLGSSHSHEVVWSRLLGGLAPSAVETIQLLESCLSPDAEPSNMATWGKLEEVEVVHLDGVNSRDVPESLGQALDLVR